jgi:serine protease AprX
LLGTQALPAVKGQDTVGSKLRGDLKQRLEEAAPDEYVRISIVLKNAADRATIDQLAQLPVKRQRRAAVVDHLKQVHAQNAAGLTAMLEASRDDGSINGRVRNLWIGNAIAVEATPAKIREIARRPDVAYINWDRLVGDEVFPVEPPRPEEPRGDRAIECGVELMNAPAVWNDLGYTGEGVVVGVIDTGVCIEHPDLADHIWNNPGEIPGNGIDDDGNGYIDDIVGWNFRDDTNDPFDDNSHGTHVAGTVAGDGTNGEQTGVAPDAQIMALKYWNNFSGETVVWEAIQYGTDNGADVLSGSFGWIYSVDPDRAMWREICENSIAAGVVMVFAAGNENGGDPPNNLRTPGDVPGVITCGAVDCSDNLAGFSSIGPVSWENIPPYNDFPYPPGLIKPDVTGPGVDTLSLNSFSGCNGYSTKSGTSMSTPHISGLAALMLSGNPELDNDDVKAAMMETAVDLGPSGPDNQYGAGRIDAFAAVSMVAVPQFTMDAGPTDISVCAPTQAVYDVSVEQVQGYDEAVTLSAEGLPAGATAIFANNPVVPPATTTLTITTDGATPGDYDVSVLGTSPDFVRDALVGLSIYDMVPSVPSLTSPPNGATEVSIAPLLEWAESDQGAEYDVQIAVDASFDDVIYTGQSTGPSHQVAQPLDTLSEYFWRVRGSNTCGDGSWSEGFSFSTQDVPSILLVDDDDNSPDVRASYTEALGNLGLDYDVWDTNNSDDEPTFTDLAPYIMVIWFTGDEFGGACGPGPDGEAALGAWLETGRCLLLSSQDYHWDRDLTDFMVDYLGVSNVDDDESQTSVTGEGDVFGDLGSMSLDYPFTNFSDVVNPSGDGELAFSGNQGNAGVTKDGGVYRTAFLGFPLAALSTTDRQAVVQKMIDWCSGLQPDCPADFNGSGDVEVEDLLELLAAWGDAGVEEDLDGSGTVEVGDLLILLADWGDC